MIADSKPLTDRRAFAQAMGQRDSGGMTRKIVASSSNDGVFDWICDQPPAIGFIIQSSELGVVWTELFVPEDGLTPNIRTKNVDGNEFYRVTEAASFAAGTLKVAEANWSNVVFVELA